MRAPIVEPTKLTLGCGPMHGWGSGGAYVLRGTGTICGVLVGLLCLMTGSASWADAGPVRALTSNEIASITATKEKPGGEPHLVNDRMTNTAWNST